MNRPGRTLLLRVLRERRGALLRILCWSLVEAVPFGVSGLLVSAAIDHFLADGFLPAVGMLALLLVAAALGALATSRLFPWLAAVVEPVRDAFLTAVVQGVVAEATRSTTPPDTAGVARLTEQVQTVRDVMFALLRVVRQIVFSAVAALVGLSFLAPLVAVISGVLVLLALALFAWLLPGLAARQRAELLAEEEVARRAGTAFGGIRDAIACGGIKSVAAGVDAAVAEQVRRARALARATASRTLIVFLGGQLPVIVLLLASPSLLRNGSLSIGELVGAVTYLTVSLEPALRKLLEVLATWGLQMAVSITRLGQEFAQQQDKRGASPAPQRHDLAVEGLTFGYGPRSAPVVADLGFAVPGGGSLAIVGASGIGKSTLANLLAGLLTPVRGRVAIGGTAVGDIGEAELRGLVGLIPQEAYVFAGTLRENLTYLAPQATEDEIGAAMAAVGLQPVTDRLGGLDALVGAGGAALSHGEKQLVALTRVHLSSARVVILDEATSGLDPDAEARAEAAFAARPGTVIVIAHRISSARRADRVLLLDGQAAYLGTHHELVATSARYADLVGHWDHDKPIPVTP
ncbi:MULTISPECIES: ABC transporter ATP-binding protein [unclassified Crossiella]|uniref:ATP-binding cassette domain-containing protein n=1 Tax=unclassified Crossiella TaxID=2620835 RepID=UPI0020002DE2|nr:MULTISPECIES: ABC transporter ATP-binding protein [unclassified Crossiella]MCK2244160.1 ABC transporter ATP-binding protein/permease [Crossiella sp. S99.2]MCK2257964.1 ABC transporter ATP-binding protein/permease [Crossiella sp. S99.1]